MAMFLVKVVSYEYGTREKEYRLEAVNPHTAAARGLRSAIKEKVFGKHRLKEWNIKVTKL